MSKFTNSCGPYLQYYTPKGTIYDRKLRFDLQGNFTIVKAKAKAMLLET